jgi:lipoprotein-anchoring transpeptidase ErfK/SrfK
MIAVLAAASVAVLGGFAYVSDYTRRDSIAHGVSIGGVDLGGLSRDAAFSRLRERIDTPLQRDVVVVAHGLRFKLTPRHAAVAIDTRSLVDEAVRVSRGGWFVSRALRDLTGGRVARSLPLTVSYSHQAVRDLVRRVSALSNRPARDASLKPSSGDLKPVAEHAGQAVNASLLGARVEHALSNPNAPHDIEAPIHPVAPKVTRAELAAKYPAYIIINRSAFKLLLFRHLKLAHAYPISVGRQGLETPAGLYDVQWKQVDPPWHVPKVAWAGKLAGQTIPPGPRDPIKARWMAFNGGAGIHGTDETSSIGHAASHGCVRMLIPDVIALYDVTPVGTPVYVA